MWFSMGNDACKEVCSVQYMWGKVKWDDHAGFGSAGGRLTTKYGKVVDEVSLGGKKGKDLSHFFNGELSQLHRGLVHKVHHN